ncbi:MAG TPA: hypothetical protein VF462_17820, partial [Micromonosporaceae bacterium]
SWWPPGSSGVGFARPADVERFAGRLADHVAALATEFDTPAASRRYRLVVAGHPARTTATEPSAPTGSPHRTEQPE